MNRICKLGLVATGMMVAFGIGLKSSADAEVKVVRAVPSASDLATILDVQMYKAAITLPPGPHTLTMGLKRGKKWEPIGDLKMPSPQQREFDLSVALTPVTMGQGTWASDKLEITWITTGLWQNEPVSNMFKGLAMEPGNGTKIDEGVFAMFVGYKPKAPEPKEAEEFKGAEVILALKIEPGVH